MEKVDSTSGWGNSTMTSGSGVWGNPTPPITASTGSSATSSSTVTVSSAATPTSETSTTTTTTSMSSSSLGWATSATPTLQSSQATGSSSAANGIFSSSGAQDVGKQPSGWGSDSNLSDPKVSTSGWGQTNSNSVISSSLSISSHGDSTLDSKGASAIGQTNSVWGAGGASSEWGTADPPKPEGSSGWGDLDPSPLPNAGTEAWGQGGGGGGGSSGSKPRGGSWGQLPSQPPQQASGWGDQPAPAPAQQKSSPSPTAGGWGDVSNKSNGSGWGDQPPSSNGSGWGESKQSSASWGAPGESQWGAAGASSSNSMWGGQSSSSTSSNSSTTSNPPVSGWNNSSQAPRPIGSQPPTSSHLPSTFAQAAGRGLPPSKPTPEQEAAAANRQKDQIISQAVNSLDGWGKKPVRQDTSWDAQESPQQQRKVPPAIPAQAMAAGGPPAPPEEANTWNQSNNGTAIWEAAKDSSSSAWQQGAAAAAAAASAAPPPQRQESNHWGGSDADGGTWMGPPDQHPPRNNWQTPPSQWGADQPGSRGSWGAPPPPPPQAAPTPNNQWQQRPPDQHQWGGVQARGPPGPPSNQWVAPPPSQPPPTRPDNQWGSAPPAPPTQQWNQQPPSRMPPQDNSWQEEMKPDNQWNPNKPDLWNKKDDPVWDRNGTVAWGEPAASKGVSQQQQQQQQQLDNNVGSWGSAGSGGSGAQSGRSSTSSWGEAADLAEGPSGWGDPEPGVTKPPTSVDDGTAFWGDPSPQQTKGPPPNWPGGQPSSMPPGHNPPGNWSGPPPSKPPSAGGWGEPGKPDDAGPFWGGQPQGKPGWGGENWPSGAGVKPKQPGNWGAEEWGSSGPGLRKGFASAPMYWEDTLNFSQDESDIGNWESHTSYSGSWNKQAYNRFGGRIAKVPSFDGLQKHGGVPQPQGAMMMRKRMLEHLNTMGFKKEDALNALINNNMNLEHAIGDLIAAVKRGELEMENRVGRQVRPQGHGSTDDLTADPVSHLVDPMPFLNQQPGAMGNMNPLKQATAAAAAVAAASLQPNLTAQQMQQQIIAKLAASGKIPPQLAGQPGGQPPLRGPTTNTQQQILQQQIVQQLQMAVQAGLISPQLLNQRLTPTMLVMLQQLLQLQQVLQRLIAQQQLTEQNKQLNPLQKRERQEQTAITIQKIKHQIMAQQEAIKKYNQNSGVPLDNPSSSSADNKSELSGLQQGIDAMNLKADVAPVSSSGSRLNVWKSGADKDDPAFNKAIGPKSGQLLHSENQPQQSPNQAKSDASPFSDNPSVWSPSLPAGSTWPSSGGTSTSSANPLSTMSGSGATADSNSDTTDTAVAASHSSNSGTPTSNPDLDIAEFVPGKIWKGLQTKTIDEDPYLTPASVSRSLSVNTIDEKYIDEKYATLGKATSTTSPTGSTDSLGNSWAGLTKSSGSKWAESQPSNELGWSTDSTSLTKNLRSGPPPGLQGKQHSPASDWGSSQQAGRPGLQHSVSWAPGDRASYSGWGGATVSSNWLMLKNLTPSVDSNNFKAICEQYGPVLNFYPNMQLGQALVCFKTKDDAAKAHKALDNLRFSNTSSPLNAELLADADVQRFIDAIGGGRGGSSSNAISGASSMSSLWSQQGEDMPMPGGGKLPGTSSAGQWNGGSAGGNMWSTGGASSSSSSSLWANPGLDDSPLLPGNLLGGQ